MLYFVFANALHFSQREAHLTKKKIANVNFNDVIVPKFKVPSCNQPPPICFGFSWDTISALLIYSGHEPVWCKCSKPIEILSVKGRQAFFFNDSRFRIQVTKASNQPLKMWRFRVDIWACLHSTRPPAVGGGPIRFYCKHVWRAE